MALFLQFVLAFFVALASSTRQPTQRQTPGNDGIPNGYEVVPMIWTGSTVPGGPNYTFTGTVQEIVKRIQEIDPSMF